MQPTITEDQKKEAELELSKRDARLLPIIQVIIPLFSEIKLPGSMAGAEDYDNAYEPTAKAILTILKEAGCTSNDYDFIKQRISGMMTYTFDKLIDQSLNITMNLLNRKVFGKDLSEVTFQEVDNLLKI